MYRNYRGSQFKCSIVSTTTSETDNIFDNDEDILPEVDTDSLDKELPNIIGDLNFDEIMAGSTHAWNSKGGLNWKTEK